MALPAVPVLPAPLQQAATNLANAPDFVLPVTTPEDIAFLVVDNEYHSTMIRDGQHPVYSTTIRDAFTQRVLYRQFVKGSSWRPTLSRFKPFEHPAAVSLGKVQGDIRRLYTHLQQQGFTVVWLHFGGKDLAHLGLCPATSGLTVDMSYHPMFASGTVPGSTGLADAFVKLSGLDGTVCSFRVRGNRHKAHSDRLDTWGGSYLAEMAAWQAACIEQLLERLRDISRIQQQQEQQQPKNG